jgi:hypothetical protein
MNRETFMQFTRELKGFNFFDKKTNKQVYRYQMYWKNLTPDQCFDMYNTKEIVK